MILDYCKLFKIILKCWLFRVLWWAAAWIEWWDRGKTGPDEVVMENASEEETGQ